ncbi:MAG: hypothetical protein R6X33_01325 [Candidatus Brocadiia bacterium]
MDLEDHNLAQIERLNQRGGRTLSIVDLIEDGTITAEMAGFCWLTVAAGGSFLTGAVPGGAGKTTLMATLLGFLPPGERIVTVSDRSVVDNALAGDVEPPATVLAHEIGSGSWFGYIWGRTAADFFRLTGRALRCVSCLHADDPQQTREQLLSLGVREEDLQRVRLQLYMRMERGGGGILRRTRALHYRWDGACRELYRWEPSGDQFEDEIDRAEICSLLADSLGMDSPEAGALWEEATGHVRDWCERGIRKFADVRALVRQTYAEWEGRV